MGSSSSSQCRGKHHSRFPFNWFPSEWEVTNEQAQALVSKVFPFNWFPSEWEVASKVVTKISNRASTVSIQLVSQRVGSGGDLYRAKKWNQSFHSIGFPASGKRMMGCCVFRIWQRVSIQLVSQRVGRGRDNENPNRGNGSWFPFNWLPSEWEDLVIYKDFKMRSSSFHSIGFPASGKQSARTGDVAGSRFHSIGFPASGKGSDLKPRRVTTSRLPF